jgi:4-amino-4-deoxy-L-arabinose transferase-like glycosyltransferase
VGSAVRERAARVPDVAWLAGIVAVSVLVRLWLVRKMPGPFIFVDELIYSELGRSLAKSGTFAIRDVPVHGYSILYPALIAPAYRLFDSLPSAYAAAKATNTVAMSLAAVPAWLLARRVAGRWLALLAAAIAVAIPSMAYTATIVTENLFYPVALLFAWTLVLALERPSLRRVALLGVVLAAAVATRSQALGFVAAALLAPFLLALLRWDARVLRPFAPLLAGTVALVVLVVGAQLARGGSLSDLLGAYSVVGEGGYDAGQVLRFWLWHVEVVTLYVCVVPVVALVVLLSRARRLPASLQEHLAATIALVATSTLVVGAFASRFASDRVQDRYLFFLAPLLVIVLLAWVELGAPRPVVPLVAGSILAVALVAVFPYDRFVGEPAKSDTFSLIPLWSANSHLLGGSYWASVVVLAVAFVALLALVPARAVIAVPLVLLGAFALLSIPVWSGPNGVLHAGDGALYTGIRGVERDWIDRSVPDGASVAVLWTGRADRFTVNQNEFFNRAVGNVYYTVAPTPGGIGETGVRVDAKGRFRTADGATIDAPYALLDGSITPDGEIVAYDAPLGMAVWRLSGPLTSTTSLAGIYPNDTWSGPHVRWARRHCVGGELSVTLFSDPNLVGDELTNVLATVHGRPVARILVPPEGAVLLRVPLSMRDGTCVVDFHISPTRIPAKRIPGSTDTRPLGVHFGTFVYHPPA